MGKGRAPIDETLRALDDLVRAGKVRYLGVSDTPAWKVAQAQGLAELNRWAAFVGLQIEYSLLQRTVEGELLPMASELGLGVTPWSPLAGGGLTGKFRRGVDNDPSRGAWVSQYLTERTFDVVDILTAAAKALDSTPARLALRWVQSRPGVASTIIGARRLDQLEDNLASLDLQIPAETLEKLDAASRPTLPFPCGFLDNAVSALGGATHINGRAMRPFPGAPEGNADRY